MTVYSDAGVMIRDIIGYLRVVPDANIIALDDPGRQMWGYCILDRDQNPTKIRWEVPVKAVRFDRMRELGNLRDALKQAASRRSQIEVFRKMAEEHVGEEPHQPEEPAPSAWERISGED